MNKVLYMIRETYENELSGELSAEYLFGYKTVEQAIIGLNTYKEALYNSPMYSFIDGTSVRFWATKTVLGVSVEHRFDIKVVNYSEVANRIA